MKALETSHIHCKNYVKFVSHLRRKLWEQRELGSNMFPTHWGIDKEFHPYE